MQHFKGHVGVYVTMVFKKLFDWFVVAKMENYLLLKYGCLHFEWNKILHECFFHQVFKDDGIRNQIHVDNLRMRERERGVIKVIQWLQRLSINTAK